MTEERMVMKVADPPPKRERRDWAAVTKRLRRKPGTWHLVIEACPISVVSAIRQGNVSALLPSKGFEVRQANTIPADADNPKRADLYLRYVRENDEEHG